MYSQVVFAKIAKINNYNNNYNYVLITNHSYDHEQFLHVQ